MVVVRRETPQCADEVLRQAAGYFGPQGMGLEIENFDAYSVKLRGTTGDVTVRAHPLAVSGMTAVEVECRGWMYVAARFLGVMSYP